MHSNLILFAKNFHGCRVELGAKFAEISSRSEALNLLLTHVCTKLAAVYHGGFIYLYICTLAYVLYCFAGASLLSFYCMYAIVCVLWAVEESEIS